MTETPATCENDLDATSSLLNGAHHFSFIQLIRLIAAAEGRPATVPELSLAFPAADVAKVEAGPDGGEYRISVNFLGLYGVSSALPTFYTEELHEEAASDATVRRDFLDIVHRRLYELYYECWRKYRIWHGVGDGDAAVLERLYALVGLAEPELRQGLHGVDPFRLIRYAGLLGRQPRSAAGLQTLLHDVLEGVPVAVVQWVARTVKIMPEERLQLGVACCRLGEDAVLGEEFADVMGKFGLRIGPVGRETFEALLSGGTLHRKVSTLVSLYLAQPLEYDVELILREDEVETVCLGSPGSARLGFNSWCFAGSFRQVAVVRFIMSC